MLHGASVVGALFQGEQFEECSSDEKQLSNHDAKGLNISVTQPCSCFMKHFWQATFHEAFLESHFLAVVS